MPTSGFPTDLEVLEPEGLPPPPPPPARRRDLFDAALTLLLVVTAAVSVRAAAVQREKAAEAEREECRAVVMDYRPLGPLPEAHYLETLRACE